MMMMMMMMMSSRRGFHWKEAFAREDVRRIWRYAAYIFVGGFVGKQLVWELAQRNIKEMHDKHNREAQQHLEKAYEDGRRLAALKRAQILAEVAREEERQQKAATATAAVGGGGGGARR